MGKKKKKSKKNRKPNIPKHTALASHLQKWMSSAQSNSEEETLNRLDSLAKGLKLDAFLSAMFQLYLRGESQQQIYLNETFPRWLASREHHHFLLLMVEQGKIPVAVAGAVDHWLVNAGVDAQRVQELAERTLFRQGYFFSNDMQAALFLVFYTDFKHSKVRALQCLIDFQPPWEGSLKDTDFTKSMQIHEWEHHLGHFLEEEGELTELDAIESKTKLLSTLLSSREQNIKLPRTLKSKRNFFEEHILSLPNNPETPDFSMETFDQLAKNGQAPEHLNEMEMMYGYQTRGPGGEGLTMMNDMDFGDFDLEVDEKGEFVGGTIKPEALARMMHTIEQEDD